MAIGQKPPSVHDISLSIGQLIVWQLASPRASNPREGLDSVHFM